MGGQLQVISDIFPTETFSSTNSVLIKSSNNQSHPLSTVRNSVNVKEKKKVFQSNSDCNPRLHVQWPNLVLLGEKKCFKASAWCCVCNCYKLCKPKLLLATLVMLLGSILQLWTNTWFMSPLSHPINTVKSHKTAFYSFVSQPVADEL